MHMQAGVYLKTPLYRQVYLGTLNILLPVYFWVISAKNVPHWRLAIFAQLDPDFLKEERC